MAGRERMPPPPPVVERDTALLDVLGDYGAKALAKHRDLRTVGDLLGFLPRRYLDVGTSGRLADFALGDQVVLIATVQSARSHSMRRRKGRMLEAVITDADGERASLVFFNAFGHESSLRPGVRGLFRGQLKTYQGSLQLAHPDYSVLDDDGDEAAEVYRDGLVPIYPHVPKVTDLQITRAARVIFPRLALGPDPVPDELRERHRLLGEQETYRALHLPTDQAEIGRARRRLRYDEALVVQTVLAQRRAAYESQEATPRPATGGGLLASFDERLPFALTEGQVRVGEEIAADLAQPRPMHRLLQGEVGSGKTVVALRAMLAAVDAGAQAALLAPTEVLAQQHHRSITAMLGDLAEGGLLGGAEHGTRVALLTGSMTRAQRERVLLDVVTGEVGIVIGTHALIQRTVQFLDLGLVVVDEQHRFGVEQRDALRDKATRVPHLLVMTATPIPRTVAMTVFGDMDTSSLGELPGGRQPIESYVVPAARPDWLARTWQRVAEEVARGHQAYVVCPRIGDDGSPAGGGGGDLDLEELEAQFRAGGDGSDDEGAPETEPDAGDDAPVLHGVVDTLEQLRQEPALAGLRVEMMHGRLPAEEKDEVMRAFAAGEVDVLVSTTVIEVGVDVPNATMMVVLDADRFGISQLHQLRGRVGRGSGGGLCLLVTGAQQQPTVERLRAVAATTDGFRLADLDLELRREGDVLGASQSGARSQLRMLRLTHRADVELIGLARADAAELVARDPTLAQHPGLRTMVEQRLDDEQVAFLERG